MLHNQNIICISSIDWDFLWQQHQTIMSTFARNGNRVLFIENTGVRSPVISDVPRLKRRIINWLKSAKGFRKEMDNLFVYSPLILPFPYMRLARLINRFLVLRAIRRWIRITNFYNPIIWTFLPTPISLDIERSIPHRAFIYYCTDNFAATSVAAQKVVSYEKEVLKKADAVFVMARNMVDYCATYNKNVTCIPMGLDVEVFLEGTKDDAPELAGLKKGRIIGFIGGVRNSIDQEMVLFLSKKFPDDTFVFVGPVQTDVSVMKKAGNVLLTGEKKHYELPAYIKRFDVCVIPYVKDKYTDNISPAKLNEYLIMGRPVVSRNLREVEAFNRENGDIIYIASDKEGFAAMISKAIAEDNNTLKERRIEAAKKNSWPVKIELMSGIVDEAIKKKEYDSSLNWQSRLLEMYNLLKKKAVRLIIAAAVLYIAVFYTPIVWLAAEPLKVSQEPVNADAIVVFAGGVGESGKAGQGYEERVEYAAELYKKGYASHMIFSSGYIYRFKEPAMMELLAISLDIPRSAIICETRATNTVENIKYTKEILDSHGWTKALVVTSPYHTRRASIVAADMAKNIKFIYTPVKESRFYSRDNIDKGRWLRRNITFSQIKGIVHEYLAIAKYLIKKYI